MACRKGAVLAEGEEYTTRNPLRASKKPMRNSCHCGNRRSFTVTDLNSADTNVRTPNTTTKEKEAELKTKNGSMLGPSLPFPPVLLEEFEEEFDLFGVPAAC